MYLNFHFSDTEYRKRYLSRDEELESTSMARLRLNRLKAWAVERLPVGSTLREAILSTPDPIDAVEFLGLARAWQQLVNLELKDRSFTFYEPKKAGGERT